MFNAKDLTSSVVIGQNLANFLENKSYETSRDKVALFAAIYEAERSEENPLVLSNEDYDDLVKAITTGDFVVDTGLYYVNVGAPIGRQEFLSRNGVVADGSEYTTSYDLETFGNATAFTIKELETIVPVAYRSSDYIMLEAVARNKYGA